jgi:hypothetical protein
MHTRRTGTLLPVESWPLLSCLVWLAWLACLSRKQLRYADGLQAGVGMLAAAQLALFLQGDRDFRSWGDVYYFCGSGASAFRYCTCDMDFTAEGWLKALTLWSFVLLTALGVQRLLVQAVLGGLLPGVCALVWVVGVCLHRLRVCACVCVCVWGGMHDGHNQRPAGTGWRQRSPALCQQHHTTPHHTTPHHTTPHHTTPHHTTPHRTHARAHARTHARTDTHPRTHGPRTQARRS